MYKQITLQNEDKKPNTFFLRLFIIRQRKSVHEETEKLEQKIKLNVELNWIVFFFRTENHLQPHFSTFVSVNRDSNLCIACDGKPTDRNWIFCRWIVLNEKRNEKKIVDLMCRWFDSYLIVSGIWGRNFEFNTNLALKSQTKCINQSFCRRSFALKDKSRSKFIFGESLFCFRNARACCDGSNFDRKKNETRIEIDALEVDEK